MRKTILLSALTVLVFSSCQKQPKADFTMSKTECYVGESVTMTDKSVDAKSYKWSIDNIEKGTGSSVSYYAENSGVKVVKLETFSKNGKKSNSNTKTLTVKNQNEAYFGYYFGDANSGCQVTDLDVNTLGSSQISFDFGGIPITASVTSLTNASIISSIFTDTDGTEFYISGGNIIRNGNQLTITINYTVYYTDGTESSNSCTSIFN